MAVTLVRHDVKYAEAMHALSSMPQVRDALGLPRWQGRRHNSFY